uniref:Uncharacterized protein n=1 Tax=Candidatus Kentrum sp. LPFa TaxID=2126335 RepID=A0A450VU33_9GAMM|nr:MAG: hypothetical protein BECKLPF1236A_GA0070988_1001521 [Candidatus Kentron sp. LPFa]VFK24127.1 MAG: hypothetical protein BECKLPF1236C_GA0070990_1001023 [Candidatus Kentron sp. LPFa]
MGKAEAYATPSPLPRGGRFPTFTESEVEIFEGFKAFFDARDARFLRARIELQFVFERTAQDYGSLV